MDPYTPTVLSLCSGAGGLELGVKLGLPEARTVCYVEGEAYAAAQLAARMEDETMDAAPIWSDVKTFNPKPWRGCVDIITAGYGFPQNNRWMMYDADPLPFQTQRTVGVVFELQGSLNNDMIFGYAKFNAFNTSWRVQSNSGNGGYVNFGRDFDGGFPLLIPDAVPGKFIMIVRQHSIDMHEFFINSYKNSMIINPRDDYYSSNRIRLMLGRISA